MPESSPAEEDLVSEILALIGREGGGPADAPGDLFAKATKKQLLDCAARLGLKGVSKLSREDLAGRIEVAFAGLAGVSAVGDEPVLEPAGATPSMNGGGHVGNGGNGGSFPPKFDLGPGQEVVPMPQDIPWGYGYDRITAMAVDPARLYAYWEATDDAIALARAGLGAGGERAWLNVRVYDITGRLFDGTNAHSYFDHRVERHERQWFFTIDKPTSTACVEIGLRSEEGYFVKIARSGRIEFPRREPVGGGGTEWLSVRGATGPVGGPVAGGASVGAGGARGVGPGPGGGVVGIDGGEPGGGGPGGPESEWQDWTEGAGFPVPRGQRLFGRTWRQEATGHQWTGEWARTEWAGPVLRTEWESGPYSYPVDVPAGSIEVQDNGEVSVRSEGGRTHVMYGPWQVVIRGIGARAERRVLGTWEYRRQIAVEGGIERVTTGDVGGGFAPGSSEWMAMGASERAWMGASELLWRGASELWLLGASETLFAGASERAFLGGSEYRFRGASERSVAGASERRLGGATERMFAGASERVFAGASERLLGGASEHFGGASEQNVDRSSGGDERRYEHDPNSPYPAPPRDPK